MTKQEFITLVEDGLGYMLSGDYPDIEIMISDQDPMWKAPYTGCTLKTGDGNIFPVLNLDALYENLCNLREYEIMDNLVQEAKNAIANMPIDNFSVEMSNYDFVKENLRLCINPVGNERNLDKIPHVMEGPFPLIAKMQVPGMCKEDTIATITISNEMLEKWEMTPEELINDAKEKTLTATSLSIMTMPDMLRCMAPEGMLDDIPPLDDDKMMYIVTTKDKSNGAGIIFANGVIDMVAERMHADGYYILPSSVHEMICLPDKAMEEDLFAAAENLTGLVNEVNETQVEENEQLKAVVTHYDAIDKKFETALEYAERKNLEMKETQVKTEVQEKSEEQEISEGSLKAVM